MEKDIQTDEFIKNMLAIYNAAISGKVLFSQQGQAMDGYSELANYRAIIKTYIEGK